VRRPALGVEHADVQVGAEPPPRAVPGTVLEHRSNLTALAVDHRQPQPCEREHFFEPPESQGTMPCL
jgi:hypothetical protein